MGLIFGVCREGVQDRVSRKEALDCSSPESPQAGSFQNRYRAAAGLDGINISLSRPTVIDFLCIKITFSDNITPFCLTGSGWFVAGFFQAFPFSLQFEKILLWQFHFIFKPWDAERGHDAPSFRSAVLRVTHVELIPWHAVTLPAQIC